MKIRYSKGSGKRIVGEWVWDKTNDYVVEISDANLAATLLTSPGFAVSNDEPLAALPGVGPQRVAELSLAGIATMNDLRKLNDDDIERIAKSIWASKKQIIEWVGIARGDKSATTPPRRAKKKSQED